MKDQRKYYMILTAKRDMGFSRHDSLNWNVGYKKSRSLLIHLLDRTLRSTLSNYAIPYQVAPQQSLMPLHIIVTSKIYGLNNFLTLSFQHHVISYNNVVNAYHERSIFYILFYTCKPQTNIMNVLQK